MGTALLVVAWSFAAVGWTCAGLSALGLDAD